MQEQFRLLSPAKINLMLRILGVRKDGYHLLQTYFQILNWGDEMVFRKTQQDKIIIEGNFSQLKTQDNLIYKAAQLLIPYRKIKTGINITVDKHIPLGSGLGGGSSNAGTTLTTLNDLWECQLSKNELLKLAIKLGADVPVFVLNTSAMAFGVGEELTPYELQNYYYVLLFPSCSISTAEIFADNCLTRNQSSIELKKINNPKLWTNACQNVVLNNYPEVKNMYLIASQFAPILMSGTGSTLFSYFNSKSQAIDFIQQCPSNWTTVLCQSKINV